MLISAFIVYFVSDLNFISTVLDIIALHCGPSYNRKHFTAIIYGKYSMPMNLKYMSVNVLQIR